MDERTQVLTALVGDVTELTVADAGRVEDGVLTVVVPKLTPLDDARVAVRPCARP